LTGQAPFVAESVLEVAVKVREEAQLPVATLCPEIPAELSALVDCCLAKRREQRFSGVLALARALEPWAPSEALALIGRIERILGGRDDQSTLDISPIVHVDSAPTHEALVARDPTLNALSTSVGPGKQVSHKPYFVRGALAAGALGVAGVVFALARSGPAEPTPNASPAASAAPVVTAAQEPSAVRRPSPSRSVVEPSVEPPAPAPERSTTKLRSPAPSRRREPRDASKPAPVDPSTLQAPSAPQPAPASALVPAAPARPVERTIDRNDPW
jgi:serine/threonine-protein kinase